MSEELVIRSNVEIPSEKLKKLENCIIEAHLVIDKACQQYPGVKLPAYSIQFENNKINQPFLYLRDESYYRISSFLLKYKDINKNLELVYNSDTQNFDTVNLQGYINFLRPIIFNLNDDCNYKNVISTLSCMVQDNNNNIGIAINFIDNSGMEINDEVVKFLKDIRKTVDYLIKNSDLDYIYNGILQHSERKYINKRIEDEMSGNISYIYIKNYIILECAIDCLFWIFKTLKYLEKFGLYKSKQEGQEYYYVNS